MPELLLTFDFLSDGWKVWKVMWVEGNGTVVAVTHGGSHVAGMSLGEVQQLVNS